MSEQDVIELLIRQHHWPVSYETQEQIAAQLRAVIASPQYNPAQRAQAAVQLDRLQQAMAYRKN